MKKEIKGYFTVEASLLFPFILLVQVIFIYLGIYCYDRCVLEQCAFEAAFRASSNMIHDTNRANEVAKEAAEYLVTDRLLCVTEVTNKVSATANDVTVSYQCDVIIPFITWRLEITKDLDYSIKVSRKVPRVKQIRTIRIQEFGKEIIESGMQK